MKDLARSDETLRRSCRRTLRLAAAAVAAGVLATAAAAQTAGDAPWTDAEKEQFLLHAAVVEEKSLATGITGSRRATLSRNGRTHDAHIQTVDVIRHATKVGNRYEATFRDSYRYNVAAYRLDRLLDLQMVPVSVVRRVGGRRAAVTWWVDDVAMMEGERLEQGLRAPDLLGWFAQKQRMRVFTQLIANTDLNQGNILITHDWQIRLVDFTRAFRPARQLLDPGRLDRVDAPLLARLRALTAEEVEDRLKDCLTRSERRGLLARRDEIVEILDRRLAQDRPVTVAHQAPDGR